VVGANKYLIAATGINMFEKRQLPQRFVPCMLRNIINAAAVVRSLAERASLPIPPAAEINRGVRDFPLASA
jgi:hypothetical protein